MNAGSAQETEQIITKRKDALQSQFKDKAGEVVKAEITQSPDVVQKMNTNGVDVNSTPLLNPNPSAAPNPPASAAATAGH